MYHGGYQLAPNEEVGMELTNQQGAGSDSLFEAPLNIPCSDCCTSAHPTTGGMYIDMYVHTYMHTYIRNT
jgi:hypothetical protein